jgi:hypothetical protein
VHGRAALAYVRTRYQLGNGSDLGRIDRQQAFLSSMVTKVSSKGLLLRPDRLVAFLDAATKSITTDPGLASLNDLRKLAQSVKGMDTDAVSFVTVPRRARSGRRCASTGRSPARRRRSQARPLPRRRGRPCAPHRNGSASRCSTARAFPVPPPGLPSASRPPASS